MSRLTNTREIVAYFIAHLARLGAVYALAAPVLVPFYRSLGSTPLLEIAALAIGALTLWLSFPLFVGLRALVTGTPAMVAPRPRAFATSWGEVAAYAVIVVVTLVVSRIVSTMLLRPLFLSLHAAGLAGWVAPLNIAIAMAPQAMLFPLFAALRRVFRGGSSTSSLRVE